MKSLCFGVYLFLVIILGAVYSKKYTIPMNYYNDFTNIPFGVQAEVTYNDTDKP